VQASWFFVGAGFTPARLYCDKGEEGGDEPSPYENDIILFSMWWNLE
jgi:hypothetical protein